jgi:hypothetical protein
VTTLGEFLQIFVCDCLLWAVAKKLIEVAHIFSPVKVMHLFERKLVGPHFGRFFTFWAIFSHFGRFFHILGDFFHILGDFFTFWAIFSHFGRFFHILGNFFTSSSGRPVRMPRFLNEQSFQINCLFKPQKTVLKAI